MHADTQASHPAATRRDAAHAHAPSTPTPTPPPTGLRAAPGRVLDGEGVPERWGQEEDGEKDGGSGTGYRAGGAVLGVEK
ncbi:hypothetical protein V499_07083 [Pseudogymnoascus sp. VKM F-103]|nr:hypothetical protein V499_07083 [Pseudogymnoascus sp. VKM F-103]